MITAKNIKKNLEIIRSDLTKMTTIKELIDYIPFSKIRLIAAFLCLLWIFSPVCIMIKSVFLNNHDVVYYYINRFELGVSWYILLQQIGLLGCLLMLLVIIKKLVDTSGLKSQRKELVYNHKPAFILLCLLSWAILSTAFSENFRLSLHGSEYRHDGLISYIAYTGLFFCGYISNEKQIFLKALNWFVWTSSLLAFLMLIDIEYINRLFTFHPNSAVFYNINHFAYYLCMAIMSSVALYMIKNNSDPQRKQFMLCFIVLVASLVKNRSFGPYLAVVAGIFFILVSVILYNRNYIKDIVIIISIFAITSLIMNILYGVIGVEIIKLISGINDIIQETETAGKAGSGRWEIWTHGLKFITEKPIFGYGPENLGARYLAEGISHDRPHNEFIQIAASLGVPALIFYLLALLRNFSTLFINRKSLTITIITLNAIIVAYLVSSFFGNTMFYTSPFYFMLLGITMGNIVSWEKTIAEENKSLQ